MQLSLFTKKQPLTYEHMNHKYFRIYIYDSFEYVSMIIYDNLGITIHMNMRHDLGTKWFVLLYTAQLLVQGHGVPMSVSHWSVD